MMKHKPFLACFFLLAVVLPGAQTSAHHSFAVHFIADEIVQVKGTVTTFRFSNPHGMLTFNSVDEAGNTVEWRAETNSPNILRRRGWDRDSFKPGDEVTVEGYPARDGTSYMRISRAVFADGRVLVGQGLSAAPEEKD